MSVFKHLMVVILISASLSASAAEQVLSPVQVERDQILSLAALAVVHRDWQYSYEGRGHNIGSILANKESVPVFWARNIVNMSGNASQHGEVRLIQEFLNCRIIGKYADDYTVYTTLEPCAMCTGLMALTKIGRAVYIQADPEYGNVRDALVKMGYPRIFDEYSPSDLRQKKALDGGYKKFKEKNPKKSITDYLLSENAKEIFASAEAELKEYKPKFAQNIPVVKSTLAFMEEVPAKGGDDRLPEFCPAK